LKFLRKLPFEIVTELSLFWANQFRQLNLIKSVIESAPETKLIFRLLVNKRAALSFAYLYILAKRVAQQRSFAHRRELKRVRSLALTLELLWLHGGGVRAMRGEHHFITHGLRVQGGEVRESETTNYFAIAICSIALSAHNIMAAGCKRVKIGC
jgi:hypothetical protein